MELPVEVVSSKDSLLVALSQSDVKQNNPVPMDNPGGCPVRLSTVGTHRTQSEEYFATRGYQSSGNLKDYFNGGDYSPDLALIGEKPIHGYPLGVGHAFETKGKDRIEGTNDFERDFVVSDIGEPSKEFMRELAEFIETGKPISRKKGKDTVHNQWDDLLSSPENKGKMPITAEDNAAMDIGVTNMLKMIVPVPGYDVMTVESLLCMFPESHWQLPVYWQTETGIKKKCLFDWIGIDKNGYAYPVDFKTTKDFGSFEREFKAGKWIQSVHYCEGMTAPKESGGLGLKFYSPYQSMLFLVVEKTNWLTKSFIIQPDDLDPCRATYNGVCEKYYSWEQDGKNGRGWFPQKAVKMWFGSGGSGGFGKKRFNWIE